MVFEAADTETRRRILQKRKRELLAELRPINQELQMMDWRELMTSQQVQDDGGAS